MPYLLNIIYYIKENLKRDIIEYYNFIKYINK